MKHYGALGCLSMVAVGAAPLFCPDDSLSLIQIAPTAPTHTFMQWHEAKEWDALVNNLGGDGPLSGAEELRFHNVSVYYPDVNTNDPGMALDLLVQSVTPYANNQSPNKNGPHGQFGAIQFNPESGTVFRWSFVRMDTYDKVTIPDFSLTFYDLDQKSGRPPCDENITAWDVHSYALVPDAYTTVTVEGPDRILVCSNTPNPISNPRQINSLTDEEKKASIILAFQDTSEFLISLRNNDNGRRKFQFSGPSKALEESVEWFQAHPTATPTAFPTASPTDAPSHSPTGSPTAYPTASPTDAPTHSPTGSPTEYPTASPTDAPTHSPTGSPTEYPTASPTGAPTHSPTDAPTDMPTHSPTGSPTGSPTDFPTSTPTVSEPTAFGDPHVMNTAGEKFNLQQAGNHSFLTIPRGAEFEVVDLQVYGQVESRGNVCNGQHYITELALAGSWLGAVRNLAFSTATEEFNEAAALGLRAGGSGNLSPQDMMKRVPQEMLQLTQYQPERPSMLNQHVSTMVAKLFVGPIKIKVSWEHTKEKQGFSNSLMLVVSGLGKVQSEVGGLLGSDDHTWAASMPPACTSARSARLPRHNSARAMAYLGEEGEMA